MENTHDLIIIGADAAGLTAGIYAGRKKINALILSKKIGGQSVMASGIENFPGFLNISGAELISKMKEQVLKSGVLIEEVEVVSLEREENFFRIEAGDKIYKALAVIVCSGRNWKTLNVKGEKEFLGRGVSVCAICDGPFFDGQTVVVVGGGNSAFDSAKDLLAYASRIYVLTNSDNFRGDQAVFEQLKKSEKVEFITNAQTTEIIGEKIVSALHYSDLKTGEVKELKTKGIFVNIGHIPNSFFATNFLKLNERGEIIINSKNETSVAGIFAAGDVTNVEYKQAVIAAGEGAGAALSAVRYLNNI